MSQKWEKKEDFKTQVIASCISMPGGFTTKYLCDGKQAIYTNF